MRIVAGQWRGRKPSVLVGETTRPTADRTRETLFSMLTSRLGSFEGLAVAECPFAGSGALGLEALSRGAASCIFVEQDAAVRVLRQNVANLGAQGQSHVRATSVLSLGPARQPLDLILLTSLMAAAQARWRSTNWPGLGWIRRGDLGQPGNRRQGKPRCAWHGNRGRTHRRKGADHAADTREADA